MKDDHYEKYKALIFKEAWRKALLSNRDFQDLVAEGNLAYVEALKTWDPDKGAFSTHLTWKMKHRFRETQAYGLDQELDSVLEIASPDNPLEACSFKEGLARLGAEALEVASVILGSSGELCDMTANKVRVTRKSIYKYYRSEKWPRCKIVNAMNEIRDMLQVL